MLTDGEKHACRTALFRKGLGHGYGSSANGYCPIGAVAVLRGAVMEINAKGEFTRLHAEQGLDGRVRYHAGPCDSIVAQAEKDVLAWTGHANIWGFLAALESTCWAVPWVED